MQFRTWRLITAAIPGDTAAIPGDSGRSPVPLMTHTLQLVCLLAHAASLSLSRPLSAMNALTMSPTSESKKKVAVASRTPPKRYQSERSADACMNNVKFHKCSPNLSPNRTFPAQNALDTWTFFACIKFANIPSDSTRRSANECCTSDFPLNKLMVDLTIWNVRTNGILKTMFSGFQTPKRHINTYL